MKYKLLALDIDGTIRNKENRITDRVKDAILAVQKQGVKVAFAMYPTSLNELMDIADAGKVMPPKSTWFEPKLLSGLFIHKLS